MRLQTLLICIWALHVLAAPLRDTMQPQNAPRAMAPTSRNRGSTSNVTPRFRSSNSAPVGSRSGKTSRKEKDKRPNPKTLGHGPLTQQAQAHAAMIRYHRNKQQRRKEKKAKGGVFGKMLQGAAKIFTTSWLQTRTKTH